MQTLNQALHRLWRDRIVTRDEALSKASDVEELLGMMGQN